MRLISTPLCLACLLAWVLTTILQQYVGAATLYSDVWVDQRLELHEAILHNQVPPGKTWSQVGGNGVNQRFAVVYLAEALHRFSGSDILTVYRSIDAVSVFSVLLLFMLYLRYWLPAIYALVGALYLAAVLAMSYHQHYFHPWDKPALLVWLLILWSMRAQRLGWTFLLLALSMTIKHDTIYLPLLYALANYQSDRARAIGLTAAMLCMNIAIATALRLALPGGYDFQMTPERLIRLAGENFADFTREWTFYAPVLAFALPLALIGLRRTQREPFVTASLQMCVLWALPFFLVTYTREVRAQLPALLLIGPAALQSLRVLLEGSETSEAPPPVDLSPGLG
jgi:hypothetical protein